MKRDYEPAVYVHEVTCPDAPKSVMVYPPRAVAQAYPTGRPHTCFSRDTIVKGRNVVVEHVDYEPHAYAESTIYPDDATRPLCEVCRGTHGAEQPTVGQSPLLDSRSSGGRHDGR